MEGKSITKVQKCNELASWNHLNSILTIFPLELVHIIYTYGTNTFKGTLTGVSLKTDQKLPSVERLCHHLNINTSSNHKISFNSENKRLEGFVFPEYSKIYALTDTFCIKLINMGNFADLKEPITLSFRNKIMIILSSSYSEHILKEFVLPIADCTELHYLDDLNLIIWTKDYKNLFWLDLFSWTVHNLHADERYGFLISVFSFQNKLYVEQGNFIYIFE